MDNNRAAVIAAVIAFIIGALFGYNLHARNVKGNDGRNPSIVQTYPETSLNGKENLVLREQLEKAARDNEVLSNQIASLKAQIGGEGAASADDCKTSLEKMEHRIFELEKENRDATHILNRIRSLISQEKK
jgi:archaellum component FlaC